MKAGRNLWVVGLTAPFPYSISFAFYLINIVMLKNSFGFHLGCLVGFWIKNQLDVFRVSGVHTDNVLAISADVFSLAKVCYFYFYKT